MPSGVKDYKVYLLHGDLHHNNIVRHKKYGWIALDPKGVIGECAYEVGDFLRNPKSILDKREAKRILKNRADGFAYELGLEQNRIVKWGVVQAVLSAWWEYEDIGKLDSHFISFAEILQSLERN